MAPLGATGLLLIEVKAAKTPKPAMAQPLKRLAGTITAYQTRSVLIHTGLEETTAGSALSPGVSAVSLPSLLKVLR